MEWCTPLQRAIAAALRAVPYGETVTYGELSALAGRPEAPRASGSFCSQNRLPLTFPFVAPFLLPAGLRRLRSAGATT